MQIDAFWSALKSIMPFISQNGNFKLVVVPFIVAGTIYLLMNNFNSDKKLSMKGIIWHFFPLNRWLSASTKVDFVMYFVQKITTIWLNAICLYVTVSLVLSILLFFHVHVPDQKSHLAPLEFALIGVALFVSGDFGKFISHYMQHKFKFLWEFHKVHHSATFLTPFTAYRFHPVSEFLDMLFEYLFIAIPVAVLEALYGFSFPELLELSTSVFILSSLFLLAGLQHSHFPVRFGSLEWIFISPLMHQLHHSANPDHWHKNMGSRLAIWDVMFGTRYILAKGETLKFGLGTEEDISGEYQRVWWCFAGPLIKVSTRAVQFSIQSRQAEDEIEVESGAPAGVFDVVASGSPEQVVGERAQAGGDVRVFSNA